VDREAAADVGNRGGQFAATQSWKPRYPRTADRDLKEERVARPQKSAGFRPSIVGSVCDWDIWQAGLRGTESLRGMMDLSFSRHCTKPDSNIWY
jgi:hypothetical protein